MKMRVVQAQNLALFEQRVNELLDEGLQLRGVMNVTLIPVSEGNPEPILVYTQAMVDSKGKGE